MSRSPILTARRLEFVLVAATSALAIAAGPDRTATLGRDSSGTGELPNVLVITVDTLRDDRLSAYSYERPTSPNLDRLMADGIRFSQARTVEPLTNPALSSMVTGYFPHEHGATRNGLRMRKGLQSLPKILAGRGYQTAAFVGNWTLRDPISGLGEHFDHFEEVISKRRWFGLFKGEATAEDLNASLFSWLDTHGGRRRPFLAWAHYTEPHAPYLLQKEFAPGLGISTSGDVTRSDRYDTEIAFVDRQIGHLLDRIRGDSRLERRTLIVFTSDHGESLGEHGYWGHGRNLYDPNLRIPLSFTWPGKIEPRVIESPALLLDVGATVLGLLGIDGDGLAHGFDWTPVFSGDEAPANRITRHQAHKGAVLSQDEVRGARRKGLLEVGIVGTGIKETLRGKAAKVKRFDLERDPAELEDLATLDQEPSEGLAAWLEEVRLGLLATSDLPPPAVDEESVEKLKALGYGG